MSDDLPTADFLPALSEIQSILADPLRFKLKLRIGDDTYALMRARKRLQEIWDVYGVATATAAAAASPLVATTLFASTAGPLAFLGIGVAATPIGWVLASGAAAGGVYLAVTRWVASTSRVDVIPHAINTPLDVLAMSLLDLMGSLALRVARIDGEISGQERDFIRRHFVEEWGYESAYVDLALEALENGMSDGAIKAVAAGLAEFQEANPDCRADAMQAELIAFLEGVVASDGVLDEREELAVDAIKAAFKSERALTVKTLRRRMAGLANETAAAAASARDHAVAAATRLRVGRSSKV